MTKDKMSKKNYNQCSELVTCIYVPFLVISCLPLFILFNLKNKKNKWGVHPPLLLVKKSLLIKHILTDRVVEQNIISLHEVIKQS